MSTEDTKQHRSKGPRKPHRRQRGHKRGQPRSEVGGLSGVLLIDKPSGITSFDVVEEIRKHIGVQRVGHCGTLDPLATGLLVLLIGEATKVAQYLTDEDKSYEGHIKLGVETDTDDSDGKALVEKDASGVTLEQAQAAAKQFLGNITQTPPRYSAQKRQGVRAYERARAGEDFEPEARPVIVHTLELTELKDGVLSFRCRVGKGTYVRSLARDIGQALGVGGHVLDLRRTFSGGFALTDGITLPALEALELDARKQRVMPLPIAWKGRPLFHVAPEDIERLRRGQQITVNKDDIDEADPDKLLALAVGGNDVPFAVGRLAWDRVTRSFTFAPERNLFV